MRATSMTHTTQQQQQQASQIRRYTAGDYTRTAHICKNVYGGSDVLPRTIQTELLHSPVATVLVSQPAADQPVDGVVCGEVRGDSFFLFGLRVAEEARGNGLATRLLAAACQHGCSLPPIQHLSSTTVPPNTPAVRTFQRLGFTHSCTVERWPQEQLQLGYEAAMGFVPDLQHPESPVQHPAGQPHLLDHLPGARQVIRQAAGQVQPSDWVCCGSLPQLQQAVTSIRQQQEEVQQFLSSELRQGRYVPPLDWLPWVYEVHPLDGPWVQQRVAAGEIWLLPAPQHAAAAAHTQLQQQQPAYAAAVVLSHSPLNSRTCAGVLAASEGGVAAALEFVDSRVPHFAAYIDSGSRHSSGGVDPQLRLPPVLDLGRRGLAPGEPYMCYVVYGRAASREGLPEVVGLSSKL